MYTVKKIEEPDRGTMYAVGAGDSIVSRHNTEEDAKEACTLLNGGEAAEKKLAAAEKKAEEDAKKAAEADQKSRAAAKPHETPHENPTKPRAHAAKAKAHVKRMTPKPTRRHK